MRSANSASRSRCSRRTTWPPRTWSGRSKPRGGDVKADTRCCIVGGGPAGMMLGYLLARAGVPVLVLEKHADFLRDFRGDTIHPSTLEILDELGLADQFLALPHSKVSTIMLRSTSGQTISLSLSRLPTKFPYIAFVPQWDFLEFLTAEARRFPTFQMKRNAEAVDLIQSGGPGGAGGAGGVVSGVRYVDADGAHDV